MAMLGRIHPNVREIAVYFPEKSAVDVLICFDCQPTTEQCKHMEEFFIEMQKPFPAHISWAKQVVVAPFPEIVLARVRMA